MESYGTILDSTLGAPATREVYILLKGLYSAHPNQHHVPVLEYDEDAFPLSRYLRHLDIESKIDKATVLFDYSSTEKEVFPVLEQGCITFKHEDTPFTVYKAKWKVNYQTAFFYDLVCDGPDDSAGRKLAASVYEFASTLRNEIWVYQGSEWRADKELYKAVQAANWDDVVLPSEFKEGIRRDMSAFFEAREVYEELGIAWKRGVLLLGPPGNGKTESIKALLKESPYPALYVKSFTTPYVSGNSTITFITAPNQV
jgi:hypothetical protein